MSTTPASIAFIGALLARPDLASRVQQLSFAITKYNADNFECFQARFARIVEEAVSCMRLKGSSFTPQWRQMWETRLKLSDGSAFIGVALLLLSNLRGLILAPHVDQPGEEALSCLFGGRSTPPSYGPVILTETPDGVQDVAGLNSLQSLSFVSGNRLWYAPSGLNLLPHIRSIGFSYRDTMMDLRHRGGPHALQHVTTLALDLNNSMRHQYTPVLLRFDVKGVLGTFSALREVRFLDPQSESVAMGYPEAANITELFDEELLLCLSTIETLELPGGFWAGPSDAPNHTHGLHDLAKSQAPDHSPGRSYWGMYDMARCNGHPRRTSTP